MPRTLRLALLLALAPACHRAPSAETPAPTPSPVPLTPVCWAGRISSEAELIGGLTAKGRVGDYKLVNDKIAVIIGAEAHGEGYSPFGGTIIDADVLRAPGAAGESRFGEILMSYDLKIVRPEAIEVIADGSDGHAAILEVRGGEASLPLLEALLPDYIVGTPRDLGITIRYTLEPGSSFLNVDYDLENRGNSQAEITLGIVGFLFGDGAQPFVPGFGFAAPKNGSAAPYYGAIGEKVSYLFGKRSGLLGYIAEYSAILAAKHADAMSIPPGVKKHLGYQLLVASGDLSRVQDQWRKAISPNSTSVVRGLVKDDRGRPVAGATVHVTLENAPENERDYVSSARSGSDGSYHLSLEAGRYALTVAAPGRPVPPDTIVTVIPERPPLDLDLSLGGTARVHYRILGEDGGPLPSKITVQKQGPLGALLPARFGEAARPEGIFALEFAPRGEGDLALPPGTYSLFASRGTEYEIAKKDLVLAEDDQALFEATLTRSVDTAGWMATDTHLHAQLSSDSSDEYDLKVRALAAEGIELPISTEHEALGDFGPAIRALHLEPFLQGVIGTEVTTSNVGHFNAFPLVPDLSLPGRGRVEWFGKRPDEMFAFIKANPTDPILQVNHPRWTGIGGYFTAMGFDRNTGAGTDPAYSGDYDTVEVVNSCRVAEIEAGSMLDWFALLSHGQKKFATGGSDSHHAGVNEVGYPKTYVRMPTDAPTDAKIDDLVAGIRAGRVSVTCGPFLEMKSGTAEVGDTLVMPGATIPITVRAEAPLWMDLDQLEIIVNGAVVKTIPVASADQVVRFDSTIDLSLPAGRDAWVIVRARGDRMHGPWGGNNPPWGFTNPIFIDADGDGQLRP
ncbi:MAG: CehA/McbA family metallohydrolase [Myxococcota bacterium]